MKIAIIGGSGFIGTRLCDLLADVTDIQFSIFDKEKSQEYSDR